MRLLAGRSVAAVGWYAHAYGNHSYGVRAGMLTQRATATTLSPSGPAFNGCHCVIGMVAVAPLTGDGTAGEAVYPLEGPRAQGIERWGRVRLAYRNGRQHGPTRKAAQVP